jgi:hypothetical protein
VYPGRIVLTVQDPPPTDYVVPIKRRKAVAGKPLNLWNPCWRRTVFSRVTVVEVH